MNMLIFARFGNINVESAKNVSAWELTILETIFTMWNFLLDESSFCWVYTGCLAFSRDMFISSDGLAFMPDVLGFFLNWEVYGIKITKKFYSVYPKSC